MVRFQELPCSEGERRDDLPAILLPEVRAQESCTV